jgi:hypothetical protein
MNPTVTVNRDSEERLAEREGVDYAKTVAEIAGLKELSADKEADRKVFRREILEQVLKFKKLVFASRDFHFKQEHV